MAHVIARCGNGEVLRWGDGSGITVHGDGAEGWSEVTATPFDRVMVRGGCLRRWLNLCYLEHERRIGGMEEWKGPHVWCFCGGYGRGAISRSKGEYGA